MRALVTGAAGFIGSRLARNLTAAGWHCVGIDRLSDYYNVEEKRERVRDLAKLGVSVLEVPISREALQIIGDVDVIFHLAAQPGVRRSWSEFDRYVEDNIYATQLIAEFASQRSIRVVFASSSSVYGNSVVAEVDESAGRRPFSPYGVTKATCEDLLGAYSENFGLSAVALRYFTVYGPGQRPDMAFRRLLETAFHGGAFRLYGDGRQSRQFTFVDDVVGATVMAATCDFEGLLTINVAGGSSVSMRDAISLCSRISGKDIDVHFADSLAGDVQLTCGSTELANSLLGWTASTSLESGLEQMWSWLVNHYSTS